MSNYKKFSLDTIKQKLKNGDYAEAVGAMRAIGKTQELSDGDKEKARVLVRKHFNIEAPAPKAPRAKKAAKKAPAKKAAKKATAKPKAARAKKAAKPAAAAAPKKAVAKKTTKKAKRSKPAAVAAEGDTATPTSEVVAEDAPSVAEPAAGKAEGGPGVLVTMGQVIGTISDMLRSMEAAKRMFPKASLEHSVEVATGVMARAVRTIDQEVVGPRLNGDAQTAAATPRKKAAKKGTRAKATSVAPSEAPEAPAANGVHDESDLSEEEQEQLRLARATQPNAEG